MKKLMISLLLTSTLGFQGVIQASKSKFIVREIDYKNRKEVNDVVEMCLNEHTFQDHGNQTAAQQRKEWKESLLQDMQQDPNYKEFMCISSKNNQICGYLSCRYGWRRPYMVEYMEIVVAKGYKFEDVLSVMNQHAQKTFAALSMKQIANWVWSKREFDFYVRHGFAVMDEKMMMKDHHITSDSVGVLFAVLTVVPLLWLAAHDHGVVYKNI